MHICDNCGSQFFEDELEAIDDYLQRVEAGCEAPSGQCPDCKALCYERDFQLDAAPKKQTDLTIKGKLIAFSIRGGDAARKLSADCVMRSVWFSVTPLPLDVYEFHLRDDAYAALWQALGLEPPTVKS